MSSAAGFKPARIPTQPTVWPLVCHEGSPLYLGHLEEACLVDHVNTLACPGCLRYHLLSAIAEGELPRES